MQTKESASLLDSFVIAAPCQVPWSSMAGNDRVRDCSHCSRKVYNLSDMSRNEAEAFIANNGASHCASFYRRADGTIMTDDCPVGLRKLRDRYRAMTKIAVSSIAFLMALPAALAQGRAKSAPLLSPQSGMTQRAHLLGKPAPPQKQVESNQPHFTMGIYLPLKAAVPNDSEPAALLSGKNGLPDDDATIGSGVIRLRAEKGIGPDSRAYHQYLRAIDNEDKGRHLVAAAYYKDALRTMTESALSNLNENQSAYDPRLKQAIEDHLHRLQSLLGQEVEPIGNVTVGTSPAHLDQPTCDIPASTDWVLPGRAPSSGSKEVLKEINSDSEETSDASE